MPPRRMMHGAHYLLHLHTRTHKLVFPRPLEISCCTDKVWGSDRRHDFVVLPGLILQPPLAPISSQKRRLQNGAMKKECPPSFLLCPIRISCSLSCPLLHRSPFPSSGSTLRPAPYPLLSKIGPPPSLPPGQCLDLCHRCQSAPSQKGGSFTKWRATML